MALSRNESGVGNRRLPSKEYLLDLIPAMLLVILCLIFFHRVLIGAAYMFPWDFVDYMYPTQRFVSDAIRSGNLPLWDPYVLLGYPIIGDPQASIFNPLYLLYHLIPVFPPLSLNSFEWLEVLYIASAGVCTYFLGRTVGIQRTGSLFAGITYMLGGFFPVHVEHETWVAASAWIPLLLLLVMRMFEKPGLPYVIAIALVFAFSLFSGYPQTTLLSVYMLVAFLAWSSVRRLRRLEFDLVRKNSLFLAAAVVLGLAISAIQLLPSTEFALNASRGTANFAGSSAGGLQPVAFVTLLFPKLLGSDGTGPFIGGEVTHSQKYSGLISLVLALTGLLRLLTRDRTETGIKSAGFLGALTLVAFAASFGANLVVYRAFELLPFITMFQRAATLFPFALLGAAILAGAECDRLTPIVSVQGQVADHDSRRTCKSWASWRIAGVLAGILSLVYLMGALSPQTIQAVFATFRVGTLPARLAEPSFAPALRQSSMEMLPIVLMLLAILICVRVLSKARRIMIWALILLTFFDLYRSNANQIFNVIERPTYEELSKLPTLLYWVSSDALGTSRLGMIEYRYLQNAGNILHVEQFNGYNPLKLRRMEDMVKTIPSINSRLFDVTNIKYIVISAASIETLDPPETLGTIAPGGMFYLPRESPDLDKFQFRASGINDGYLLYENREVLPRFFAINEYQIVPDADQRLAILGNVGFDPSKKVLLEEPFAETLVGRLDGTVDVLHYGINGFDLTAQITGGRTLLFLSIPYYPGWKAFVNDVPVKIYAADHAFMAIPIGPGENIIRMSFEPISFKLGAWITAMGVALCFVALVSCTLLHRRFRLFGD